MKKTLLTIAIAITFHFTYAQYLPLTSGSGSPLTGNLYINKITPGIILDGTGFGNSGSYLNMQGWASTNNNWQIGVANIGYDGLMFTPSTSGGGSTFSTPAMIINSNGKVGIGTTSPGSILHLYQSAGETTLKMQNNSTYSNLFAGNGYAGVGSFSNDPFIFYTNSTERMRFSPSGNLGIGTTGPNSVLQIHNNVAYADNANNQLTLSNGGYRNSEEGTLNTDNAGMAYYFTNYNAGGKVYDRTLDIRVRGAGDGTFGAGMIRFFANDYSSGSAEREIMRIHGNGNVGIGTTSPNSVLQIHNNVAYADNANNQLTMSNGGYRNSEEGTLNTDNAGMAFYFTNYNAGGKWYDRTLDIRVRGAGDGTFGAGMIRFFANDYTSGSAEREIMRIHGNGNVGIGVTSPAGLLSLKNQIPNGGNGNDPVNYTATSAVNGQAIINSYYVGNTDGGGPYPRYMDIASVGSPDGTNGGGNIRFLTNPVTANSPAVERMRINSNGNIGIGTINPDTKLAVRGTIHSTEVKVDLSVPVPDYVFKPDYKLTNLSELKAYVDKNHHLPEIPSAEKMAKDGLNLGEMNTKLLKKVEELTLYLIQQKEESDKRNKAQQEQINQLKEQLNAITKALIKN